MVRSAPTLVYCPHPINAIADRRIVHDQVLPGETLSEYIERAGIRLPRGPLELTINHVIIPRSLWGKLRPRPGSFITLRRGVAGGGGGKKDPMRTVLMLAIIVASSGWGATLGEAMLGEGVRSLALPFGGSISAAALGGAVIAGGGALVMGFLPTPRSNLAQAQLLGAQPSPTYSLQGGSNRARPYEQMQLVLGKHRVFADYGARWYTEFEGDDQYLYQVFHFGVGDVLLSDYRIGTTPLTDFSSFEIQVAPYSGQLTLVPANVDTVAGGALDPDVWVTRSGTVGATALAVEVTGSLYSLSSDGYAPASVDLQIWYRPVGGAWQEFVFGAGTIVYTHYWSAGYEQTYEIEGSIATRWVQQDYGTTDAGEHVEGAAHATLINPLTGTASTWYWRLFSEVVVGEATPPSSRQVQTAYVTITNADSKPLRKTWKIDVPAGHYEVQVKRITAAFGAGTVGDLAWSQLRCYSHDDTDYTGQVRVGLKIKASGQLQGQVAQFSALASSRFLVWDGVSAWAQLETSNPGWIGLGLARGKKINGRLVFGGGLPDSRIDIDAWKAFSAWCDAKNLRFDGVVDRSMSLADALDAVCWAGRGSKSRATGKLGVVWDDPDEPESNVYGMGDIVAGSYRIDYVTEKLAEEIVVNFWNPDLDWQQDSVRALVPGVVTPTRTRKIDFWGCASNAAAGAAKDEAGRQANLIAADQYYHNAKISFELDIAGWINKRGDVIRLAHDIMRAKWGWSGRLHDASSANVLNLDAPVTFTPATDHYVLVKKPDASFGIYPVVYHAGTTDQITLSTPLAFNPSADPNGNSVYDYTWFFDLRPNPGRLMRIVDYKVLGADRRIRVTCQDHTADYYARETEPFVYTAPTLYAGSPPVLANLTVTESIVPVADGYLVRLSLTWDVSSGVYDHARVRAGWQGSGLIERGQPQGRRFDIDVPDGASVDIEVTGIHPLYGVMGAASQLTATHVIVGLANAATPPNVTGLALAAGGTTFAGPNAQIVWNAVDMAYFKDYEIEVWSQLPALLATEHSKSNTYTLTFQRNYEIAGGAPIRTINFKVFARNLLDARSAAAASIVVANPAPTAPA